jgi:hypothetical protein
MLKLIGQLVDVDQTPARNFPARDGKPEMNIPSHPRLHVLSGREVLEVHADPRDYTGAIPSTVGATVELEVAHRVFNTKRGAVVEFGLLKVINDGARKVA